MHHIGHIAQSLVLSLVLIELIGEGGVIKLIHFNPGFFLGHDLDASIKTIRKLPGMHQCILLPGSKEILKQLPGTRCNLVSSLVEGIEFRGVFTEDLNGLGSGAIEARHKGQFSVLTDDVEATPQDDSHGVCSGCISVCTGIGINQSSGSGSSCTTSQCRHDLNA